MGSFQVLPTDAPLVHANKSSLTSVEIETSPRLASRLDGHVQGQTLRESLEATPEGSWKVGGACGRECESREVTSCRKFPATAAGRPDDTGAVGSLQDGISQH